MPSQGSTQRLYWIWLLPLAFAAVLILYPTLMLIAGSFSDAPPGEPGNLTIRNYIDAIGDKGFYKIAFNSFWMAVLATVLSVSSGFFLAWLVNRTDVPFRRSIEAAAILAFLIPGSLQAIGWAVLANPDSGIVNSAWRSLTGSPRPLIDIYSYAGIAFVLAQHAAGFVYLMLIGPMRNLDPSLEESARMSGASGWQVFAKVQLPLLWPAVLPLAVLAFIRAIESFEVPVILGTPARVFVITNEIYYKLKILSPPEYGIAIALSVMISLVMGILLAVHGRLAVRRSVASLTGKGYRPRRVDLGRWRWPCLALALGFALLSSLAPLGIIVTASFFKVFGLFELRLLTLDNYVDVLGDPAVFRAVGNTLLLMAAAASVCVVLGGLSASAMHRSLRASRGAAEAVLSVPWAMPGLVFGMAMLWAYISLPGFYGTLLVLGVAYVTLGLPIGVRSASAILDQLSPDLEESALMHGATQWQTVMRIVVPLAWPGLVAAWFVLATIFSRELAASVMLYGHGSETVSVMLLGYWEQGKGTYVAVMAVIMLAILGVLIAAERIVVRKQE